MLHTLYIIQPLEDYSLPGGSRAQHINSFIFFKAAGIGILVVVLAVLLIIGCWYYKRRCGYKNLRSKSSHAGTMRRVAGEDAPLDCKALLQEYSNFNSVVPDAPPAYDKVSADPLPPPYSP
uniref:Melan-A n=1 Tax=Gopherus evgoodei TaxID=1825980 RepID=A0A8C5F0E7_9SAUR